MFNKESFSILIKKIKDTYDSQEEFSKKSGIGRTYLSQYMNQKMDKPPKETILNKLADASNGITTYKELLYICGYLDSSEELYMNALKKVFETYNNELHDAGLTEDKIRTIYLSFTGPNNNELKNMVTGLSKEQQEKLKNIFQKIDEQMSRYKVTIVNIVDNTFNFLESDLFNSDIIEYKPIDNSMFPLLDIGDVAYIEKQSNFNSGDTILFELENKEYIRKATINNKTVEFKAMNPYFPVFNYTKEELKNKGFKLIGRVTKVENKSAFK